MKIEVLIDKLRTELPLMFTRKTASKLTGNYISPRTFANLDSQGKGPGGIRIGKTVCYTRDNFLDWLKNRFKPKKTIKIKEEN